MEKWKGGRPAAKNCPNGAESSEYTDALKNAEISTKQSSKFQHLAKIPEDEFEDELKSLDGTSKTSAIRW